jgi:hypothetical protein
VGVLDLPRLDFPRLPPTIPIGSLESLRKRSDVDSRG